MQNFIRLLLIIFFPTFLWVPKSLSQNLEVYSQLTIATDKRKHVFRVEVVRTPTKRSKGLQGRLYLGLNEGMLFSFEKSQI